MKQRHSSSSLSERFLASLGLALIVALGWACDQPTRASHPALARMRQALAWLVVTSVTVTGWVIDHLHPVEVKPAFEITSAEDIHVEPRHN